ATSANLVDLKIHLREELVYLQVLEDYLRNVARLIDELRKLERSEYEAHSEGTIEFPRTDLRWRSKSSAISRTSRNVPRQEKMEEIPEEEPVPALVHGDGGVAIHGEETIDVIPGAPAVIPERMEVETVQEIVL
uniref:Uncharacterized protein n=1 Tax=Wuchereria bancrofti TaxID=6293 RepID=A0AAF5RSX5_WUCBA